MFATIKNQVKKTLQSKSIYEDCFVYDKSRFTGIHDYNGDNANHKINKKSQTNKTLQSKSIYEDCFVYDESRFTGKV